MNREIVFIAGVFVGANLGIVIGAWLRYISREDDNLTAIQALKAVRNENGGLSAPTRRVVNDALLEHESRIRR